MLNQKEWLEKSLAELNATMRAELVESGLVTLSQWNEAIAPKLSGIAQAIAGSRITARTYRLHESVVNIPPKPPAADPAGELLLELIGDWKLASTMLRKFSLSEYVDLIEAERLYFRMMTMTRRIDALAAARAHLKSEGAKRTDYRPQPHILWNGGAPELWLLYLKDGTLTPVADFGPEPTPAPWRALLLSQRNLPDDALALRLKGR